MKVFILLSILFFVTLGSSFSNKKVIQVDSPLGKPNPSINPSPKLCGQCVQFSEEFMGELIKLVYGGVVGDTCIDICSALAAKTNSTAAGEICLMLCTIVGSMEFVKILDKIDLNYIYFCEQLKACAVFDYGDLTITSLKVVPPSGPRGTTFTIMSTMMSKNGTGTGENIIFIDTVDHIPVFQVRLMYPEKPGNYSFNLEFDATPPPGCQTGMPCEQWFAGNYTVRFDVCNGECGSKDPHSKVYDKKTATFAITEN